LHALKLKRNQQRSNSQPWLLCSWDDWLGRIWEISSKYFLFKHLSNVQTVYLLWWNVLILKFIFLPWNLSKSSSWSCKQQKHFSIVYFIIFIPIFFCFVVKWKVAYRYGLSKAINWSIEFFCYNLKSSPWKAFLFQMINGINPKKELLDIF
jgi:hypothetical protein